eukprot:5880245-Pyramimonas_sp.AAC.1
MKAKGAARAAPSSGQIKAAQAPTAGEEGPNIKSCNVRNKLALEKAGGMAEALLEGIEHEWGHLCSL